MDQDNQTTESAKKKKGGGECVFHTSSPVVDLNEHFKF